MTPRKWFFTWILVFATTVAPLGAQVMAVHFKDTKAAEKYRKFLIQVNGEYIVAGEPKLGGDLKVNAATGQITIGKRNEFYAADPGAPDKVPYTLSGEERLPVKGGNILAFPQEDIARLSFLMRDQTLAGLAAEYKLRLDGINEIKKKRDAAEKTTREWALHHGLVVGQYERLRDWLNGTLFNRAAQNLEKTLLAEASAMKDDALKARSVKAQKSARKIDISEDLVQANQEISGGKIKFKAVESQHVRIVFDLATVGEAEALALVKLAETCIEGFRREFVDPYLSEEFDDPIPEELFIEFWFGPDEVRLYERFFMDYYGRDWGSDRETRLQMAGTRSRFARGVNYVDYWKSTSESDHEGMITHGLGHALSNLHFNFDGQNMSQDWIGEACGYYMSFEYLGRNSVTCKDFQKRTYAHDPGEEGLKTVAMGQRAAFNLLALSKGSPIEGLAIKNLFQMDDADLAKAWSFFDYVARKEGLTGVRWLQSACRNARTPKGFIDRWREESMELFGIKGADPFKHIDEKWKAFARSGQRKDDSVRKTK